MEIKYFTQNIKLSGELKDHLEEKIKKFSRYLNKIKEVQIDLSYNPSHKKDQLIRLEINLKTLNKLFRAVVRGPNISTAIDQIEKKLRKQLEKYKENKKIKRKVTRKIFRKVESL
jgi:ribosomal subunit interface protein